MSDFKVTFDKGFDRLGMQISNYKNSKLTAIKKSLDDSAKQMKKDIQESVPIKTGSLKKSIFIRSESKGLTKIIGSKKFYFHIVAGGAKPHTIKPKNKKMLAWNSGSFYAEFLTKRGRATNKKVYKTSNGYSLFAEDAEMSFAKGVKNPGTKADDFVDKAFTKGRENLNYEIIKILKEKS